MRRLLVLVSAAAGLLLAGRPAAAGPPTGTACCACFVGEQHNATTSQALPVSDVLFCGFVTLSSELDFRSSCDVAGGNGVTCANPPSSNQTCSEILLSASGITCPASAPAPAATGWGLTALALALSGFGIAAMRRRVR